MNSNNLLDAFGEVKDQYILTAVESREGRTAKGHGYKKPLLIAAVIALMLVLVGCAAVYMLRMQDMKMAEVMETQPVFADTYGEDFIGFTEVPHQVLTVNGIQGTPAYQASQEWFEFTEAYDVDRKILNSVWSDMPEFPNQYDAFNIYSQEMADKIDEIAEKFDLKLPGEGNEIPRGRAKDIYHALGIEGLLRPNSAGLAAPYRTIAFEGGNIHMTFTMLMDKENEQWAYPMVNSFYFLKNGYFDPQFISMDETEPWEEWNYTTKSGNDVLLLLSETSGYRSSIIFERADAIIVVQVESVYSNETEFGKDGWPVMTKRQLEQVADTIDFDMQPKVDISMAQSKATK